MAGPSLTLVIILLAITSVVRTTRYLCPEGGCRNLTIYLGPRWGSKVILIPKNTTFQEPSEEGHGRESNVTRNMNMSSPAIEIEFLPDSMDYNVHSEDSDSQDSSSEREHLLPKQKPISDDNSVRVNYEEEDEFPPTTRRQFTSRTSPAWMIHRNPQWRARNSSKRDSFTTTTGNPLYVTGTLNLTYANLTGLDVKEHLSNLSRYVRLQHLLLSHNNIEYLPPPTFTIDMEYSLLELRLDHNPLGTLNGYTRFELSRLGRLKILSLAHTGLRYLEPLYVPSLEVLDLSDNRIASLDSVENLPHLRELYLDNNRITFIYEPSLTPLYRLRVLSLANNRLSFISGEPLFSFISLDTLRLNNNSLEFLPVLNKYTTTKVYLSGNPLECSCPLLEVVNRPWPDIADKETVTCIDKGYPQRVQSLNARDLHIGCPSVRHKVKELLRGVYRWCQDQGYYLSRMSMFSVLGWVLFIVLLGIKIRSVRRARRKVAPLDVPYNILDDKQVV